MTGIKNGILFATQFYRMYGTGTALCEGITPLGYWLKVNQLPTQTKPYGTLPPFEQRDSWSSYVAVRACSEVILLSPGTQGE